MADFFESLRAFGSRQRDDAGVPRIVRATGLLTGVFVLATLFYWAASPSGYGLLDSAYMTAITLATVGFREVIPIRHDPVLQTFTIVLIVVGTGTMLYFASAVTVFIIEGELRDIMHKRRMNRGINKLDDHVIICGIGETGAHVLEEVLRSNQACVVIDHSHDRVLYEQQKIGEDFFTSSATPTTTRRCATQASSAPRR